MKLNLRHNQIKINVDLACLLYSFILNDSQVIEVIANRPITEIYLDLEKDFKKVNKKNLPNTEMRLGLAEEKNILRIAIDYLQKDKGLTRIGSISFNIEEQFRNLPNNSFTSKFHLS